MGAAERRDGRLGPHGAARKPPCMGRVVKAARPIAKRLTLVRPKSPPLRWINQPKSEPACEPPYCGGKLPHAGHLSFHHARGYATAISVGVARQTRLRQDAVQASVLIIAWRSLHSASRSGNAETHGAPEFCGHRIKALPSASSPANGSLRPEAW